MPAYLIADPCEGQCFLCAEPKNGSCRVSPAIRYGDPIDLTATVAGLTITPDELGRD
ncbi:hypothetical protein [Streptomyces luteoverticillatus]|uniref:hypothetical protein n=1 Tax=Streptomyces luteoverticillatus TaxID=66425 RepID=UPI001F0BCA98|nr:hypothetical protein [Streptomyces luteoverticillatus]